jgi:hypothetical protein
MGSCCSSICGGRSRAYSTLSQSESNVLDDNVWFESGSEVKRKKKRLLFGRRKGAQTLAGDSLELADMHGTTQSARVHSFLDDLDEDIEDPFDDDLFMSEAAS